MSTGEQKSKTPGESVIRLTIPADMRFLRIARLTAAGIAGDLGFGLQDVEDLRVAVDEMCAALIEDADPAFDFELAYRISEGQLVIEGRCPQGGPPPALHPVARELLTMTADDFSIEGDDDGRRFLLIKRRSDLTV
jgi:serine/threonine-protein kinase RsbW